METRRAWSSPAGDGASRRGVGAGHHPGAGHGHRVLLQHSARSVTRTTGQPRVRVVAGAARAQPPALHLAHLEAAVRATGPRAQGHWLFRVHIRDARQPQACIPRHLTPASCTPSPLPTRPGSPGAAVKAPVPRAWTETQAPEYHARLLAAAQPLWSPGAGDMRVCGPTWGEGGTGKPLLVLTPPRATPE